MKLSNVKRLVAPVTYMVCDVDDMIDVDTSSGQPTTLYIPNIVQNGYDQIPKKIYINDVSNNASVGKITVVCIGGNTINNLPQVVLESNGVSAEIEIADRTRYIANLNTDNEVSSVFTTPRIIYVDDKNGNDATGEIGFPNKPYLTIDAATNVAVTGDTIIASRGTYYIGSPFKPNVVYDLGTSIIIAYTNIISSSYGSGTFKVYGKSDITCYNSLITGVSGSDVYLESNTIRFYSTCIGGSVYNSNIVVKSELIESLNNGAFCVYLEGDSINVVIDIFSISYILFRGFISWFNGVNPIQINIYGTRLLHKGTDYYASLAWILGDGMNINFYVNDIVIDSSAANSFFPWYGVLNVYSKVTCKTDISYIMADGGVSTFFADINAPLGLLYVRGGVATVVLKADLLSDRPNSAVLIVGNLTTYGNIKSTDLVSVTPIIDVNGEFANLMLNNSKIIGSATKPCIEDTNGTPNLVQVYGKCYSVTVPVNITQAPESISQYPALQ